MIRRPALFEADSKGNIPGSSNYSIEDGSFLSNLVKKPKLVNFRAMQHIQWEMKCCGQCTPKYICSGLYVEYKGTSDSSFLDLLITCYIYLPEKLHTDIQSWHVATSHAIKKHDAKW